MKTLRTERLIAALSLRIEPVRRYAVERRVLKVLFVGAFLATAVLLAWLGLRPDIPKAVFTSGFWLKLLFTLSVGVAATDLSCRLGRPACGSRTRWLALAAIGSLMIGAGIFQIVSAPSDERLGIWLGGTWQVCPIRIMVLSAPSLVGMMWAIQRMAPTHLLEAGLSVGLAAGGVGASVYTLTCPESSLAFVATWYSLGILAVGMTGAFFGPSLLRW